MHMNIVLLFQTLRRSLAFTQSQSQTDSSLNFTVREGIGDTSFSVLSVNSTVWDDSEEFVPRLYKVVEENFAILEPADNTIESAIQKLGRSKATHNSLLTLLMQSENGLTDAGRVLFLHHWSLKAKGKHLPMLQHFALLLFLWNDPETTQNTGPEQRKRVDKGKGKVQKDTRKVLFECMNPEEVMQKGDEWFSKQKNFLVVADETNSKNIFISRKEKIAPEVLAEFVMRNLHDRMSWKNLHVKDEVNYILLATADTYKKDMEDFEELKGPAASVNKKQKTAKVNSKKPYVPLRQIISPIAALGTDTVGELSSTSPSSAVPSVAPPAPHRSSADSIRARWKGIDNVLRAQRKTLTCYELWRYKDGHDIPALANFKQNGQQIWVKRGTLPLKARRSAISLDSGIAKFLVRFASNGDEYVFGWDVARKIMHWNHQIADIRRQLDEAISNEPVVRTARVKVERAEDLWVTDLKRQPVEAAQAELDAALLKTRRALESGYIRREAVIYD